MRLAEANGVRLAVNQNGRWAPHHAWMRAAVRRGLIGELQSVVVSISWDHSWIVGTPFEAIGDLVLYDFAIHWFDFLASLAGPRLESVYATATRGRAQTARAPLLAQALVRMDGGQAALAFDGATAHGPRDTTSVTGTLGSLTSVGPNLGEQTVTLTTADGRATPALEGTWFNDGFRGAMGELLCRHRGGSRARERRPRQPPEPGALLRRHRQRPRGARGRASARCGGCLRRHDAARGRRRRGPGRARARRPAEGRGPRRTDHADRRRAPPALRAPAAHQGVPSRRAAARAPLPASGELLFRSGHRPSPRRRGRRDRYPPAGGRHGDGRRASLRRAGARHRRHAAPPAGGDRRRPRRRLHHPRHRRRRGARRRARPRSPGAGGRRRLHRARGRGGGVRARPRRHGHRAGASDLATSCRARDRRLLPRPPPPPRRGHPRSDRPRPAGGRGRPRRRRPALDRRAYRRRPGGRRRRHRARRAARPVGGDRGRERHPHRCERPHLGPERLGRRRLRLAAARGRAHPARIRSATPSTRPKRWRAT